MWPKEINEGGRGDDNGGEAWDPGRPSSLASVFGSCSECTEDPLESVDLGSDMVCFAFQKHHSGRSGEDTPQRGRSRKPDQEACVRRGKLGVCPGW